MSLRPPRFSEWLMRRAIADGDRDAIIGDLHEEFGARVSRDGARAAARWYRRQVRRSVAHGLRQQWNQAERTNSGLRGTMQDVRFAIRSLRTTPTFTAVALIVLALGIGATTAIFSVVDGVALRGLPFAQSDRLVALTEINTSGRGNPVSAVSAPDLMDWRAQQTSFEGLGVSAGGGRGFLLRSDGPAEVLRVTQISSNLIPILRASPALGRGFTPDDEVRGNEHVLLLSDQFWRKHFNGDPQIVGKTMAFDSGVWTIVGVMPASFMYPAALTRPMDMWTPYLPTPGELPRGDGRTRRYNADVIGRLKPGVTLVQARAEMERITARMKVDYPEWFRDRQVSVLSLQDAIVGPAKSWMLMLLGAVTCVLLIACVNVANLLLARASARSRDAAVRAALGASRWRILRALLIESLVLSATGTAIGVGVAVWGVSALRASLPATLPRINEVSVNYRVLLAAAAAAIVVAIGVTPVWQSSPQVFSASLRESGRSAAGGRRRRVRAGLLVAEVALAMVLLVGSGLFVSSFVKLMRVDLGFDFSNVLSVVAAPRTGSPRQMSEADTARTAATLSAIFEEVRRVPDITSFALVAGTPPLVNGHDRTGIQLPGRPPVTDTEGLDDKTITAEYFQTLRVPLVAGRYFTEADSAPGAPAVIILNDIGAKSYFGNDNPIGALVRVGEEQSDRTIVGIVRAVRLFGPEGELHAEMYLPFNWQHAFASTLVAQTSSDAATFAPAIRAAIHRAAPDLIVPEAQTYDSLFAAIIAQRKFNMVVLALFGLLAIAIAAAGIYGVMAYVVEQRTQEIGVRMALGAHPARVLRMVLGGAGFYIGAGLSIGLAGGWMLSRFVQAFLFRIDAHDPLVYAAAAAVLVATGLVAALVPARRAARVDPVIALRSQ